MSNYCSISLLFGIKANTKFVNLSQTCWVTLYIKTPQKSTTSVDFVFHLDFWCLGGCQNNINVKYRSQPSYRFFLMLNTFLMTLINA